jgi:hypothetical protein
MNNTEKLIELHREFARCYELSKVSGVDVSRLYQRQLETASHWSEQTAPYVGIFNPNHTYRFALAVVEGKPVFEGDELYHDGIKRLFGVTTDSNKQIGYIGRWSWNPPQPVIPDGWEKWDGGECPVSGSTLVEVITDNNRYKLPMCAGAWYWDGDCAVRIIAYRIIKPTITLTCGGKSVTIPKPRGNAWGHLDRSVAFEFESNEDRDTAERALQELLS